MKQLMFLFALLPTFAFVACNSDNPDIEDPESKQFVEWIKSCVLDDKGEIVFIKNDITEGLYAIPAGSAENAAWFVEDLTRTKWEGDTKTVTLGDGLGSIRIAGSGNEGVYNTLVFNIKDIPPFTLEIATWEYINNDNSYGSKVNILFLKNYYLCDNCSNISKGSDGCCPHCGFSYEGIEEGLVNAKVGDLYCITKRGNRGYVIPSDKATDIDKERCIGVVIYAGHHPNDKSDYSATGIGSATCHGYAIAKSFRRQPHIGWGPEDHGLSLFPDYPRSDEYKYWEDGSEIEPDNRYVTRDWSGYLYTTRIIEKAGGKDKLGENAISGFPATYLAVNGSGVAPVNSSGWFLPSMGQLVQALNERNSLSVAGDHGWGGGDTFWSSNTTADSPKVYTLYFLLSYDPWHYQYLKELEFKAYSPSFRVGGIVRSAIAF